MVNERSIRLYLAIKKIVQREKWDFYTIQSFPGLGDDYSRDLLRPEHDAGRRLGHLDAGRLQHRC